MVGSSIGGDELPWGREGWRVRASLYSAISDFYLCFVATFCLVPCPLFYYFYFCQVLRPISQFTRRFMWIQIAPEAWFEWSMLLKEVSE